jgi:predicted neuraminidase
MVFFQDEPVYAWFGGTQEGNPDSAIFIQMGGNVFGIGTDRQMARWNPILFTYEDKLYLFAKAGVFCDRWQTFLYDITDIERGNIPNPQVIPAGLNGPVKTEPLFHDGYMYCGSAVETAFNWTSYIEKYRFVDGKLEYVNRSAPIEAPVLDYETFNGPRKTKGIIQPALWVNQFGHLNAFFRSSTGLGEIFHSQGSVDDRHLSMTKPNGIKLQNPNSGVDVVYMKESDRLFLVYNPSDHLRVPICVAELEEFSDGTYTFDVLDELVVTKDVDPAGSTHSRELSYPYMIEHDGKLHLVYTYGRSKIEHVTIEV